MTYPVIHKAAAPSPAAMAITVTGESRPRRMSEMWKLMRDTRQVHALGPRGVTQFNRVASAIWCRLDGERSVVSIIDELVAAYPLCDRGKIESDILIFVTDLAEKGLVVIDWQPL